MYFIYDTSVKEREAGEVIAVSATQSATQEKIGETTFQAAHAIDRLYHTQSWALRGVRDGPWLEVSLDKDYCITKVTWYKSDLGIMCSWRCIRAKRYCKLDSFFVPEYNLMVYQNSSDTEENFSREYQCKVGDTLRLTQNVNFALMSVNELSIIAKTGKNR